MDEIRLNGTDVSSSPITSSYVDPFPHYYPSKISENSSPIPQSITVPDAHMLAREWATLEIIKKGPSADPLLDILNHDTKVARLTRQRMDELEAGWE